jgi:four helix bundle protein
MSTGAQSLVPTGDLKELVAWQVAMDFAEGHGPHNRARLRRFVLIARGSLKEAETQILLAQRLGFLSDVLA